MQDFWLIVAEDFEWVQVVLTSPEIIELAWQPDAVAIYRCCPADRLMNDVTEDCARDWFAANWRAGDKVPALFRQFVGDEADAANEIAIYGDEEMV